MHDLMMLLHNCVSHPIMGVLQLLGFDRAAAIVHDVTLTPYVPPADLNGFDSDEIVSIVKISDEHIEAGHLFTELLTLSNGKAGVEHMSAEGCWVVKYQETGGDTWKQVEDANLNTALETAVQAQVNIIANGGAF